jgi:hypothetical protein
VAAAAVVSAVGVNSGDRPIARGNRIHHNFGSGIRAYGDATQGGDGVITGALFEANLIYGNHGGAGMNLNAFQDAVIRNNLIPSQAVRQRRDPVRLGHPRHGTRGQRHGLPRRALSLRIQRFTLPPDVVAVRERVRRPWDAALRGRRSSC